MAKVTWKNDPETHDYPAAASYLSLIAPAAVVDEVVRRLQAADVAEFKAKDILRAAGLALLGADNVHVAADLDKVKAGKALSPVLMVRGDMVRGLPSQIADGYHRVCASYHLDENTSIPCHIVDHP